MISKRKKADVAEAILDLADQGVQDFFADGHEENAIDYNDTISKKELGLESLWSRWKKHPLHDASNTNQDKFALRNAFVDAFNKVVRQQEQHREELRQEAIENSLDSMDQRFANKISKLVDRSTGLSIYNVIKEFEKTYHYVTGYVGHEVFYLKMFNEECGNLVKGLFLRDEMSHENVVHIWKTWYELVPGVIARCIGQHALFPIWNDLQDEAWLGMAQEISEIALQENLARLDKIEKIERDRIMKEILDEATVILGNEGTDLSFERILISLQDNSTMQNTLLAKMVARRAHLGDQAFPNPLEMFLE